MRSGTGSSPGLPTSRGSLPSGVGSVAAIARRRNDLRNLWQQRLRLVTEFRQRRLKRPRDARQTAAMRSHFAAAPGVLALLTSHLCNTPLSPGPWSALLSGGQPLPCLIRAPSRRGDGQKRVE